MYLHIYLKNISKDDIIKRYYQKMIIRALESIQLIQRHQKSPGEVRKELRTRGRHSRISSACP
jgi:hypothetical protein